MRAEQYFNTVLAVAIGTSVDAGLCAVIEAAAACLTSLNLPGWQRQQISYFNHYTIIVNFMEARFLYRRQSNVPDETSGFDDFLATLDECDYVFRLRDWRHFTKGQFKYRVPDPYTFDASQDQSKASGTA
ncbi:hypothetical protein CKAH01_10725 [Colletotrichum kahawae]|uniref:Uncharacterized protein n=1 Tax=Colletotrichum kahawae TaxID=34407 RepID=A0AAE0CWY6_COLKA|nr:hypothetical protein CKAH01_10725 [Colletotrichum kahawae]